MKRLLSVVAAFALLASPALAQTVYGTSDLARNQAVIDVTGTGPSGQTTVKAAVVSVIAATGASSSQVQGAGASGAAAVGNPVGIGCAYRATPPALTDGWRSDVVCGARGQLLASIASVATGGSDGISANFLLGIDAATGSSRLPVFGTFAFNGSSFDRARTIQGSDGTGLGVQAMATAPQSSAAGAITPAVGSLVSNVVGKASAGNLYGVELNAGATALWLYVFNSTSAPGDGAVTAGNASGNYQFCRAVAANGSLEQGFAIPERYSVGITLVASSTACGTLTKSTTPIFIKARAQ